MFIEHHPNKLLQLPGVYGRNQSSTHVRLSPWAKRINCLRWFCRVISPTLIRTFTHPLTISLIGLGHSPSTHTSVKDHYRNLWNQAKSILLINIWRNGSELPCSFKIVYVNELLFVNIVFELFRSSILPSVVYNLISWRLWTINKVCWF